MLLHTCLDGKKGEKKHYQVYHTCLEDISGQKNICQDCLWWLQLFCDWSNTIVLITLLWLFSHNDIGSYRETFHRVFVSLTFLFLHL